MNKKIFLIGLGFLVSLFFLIFALQQVNWSVFFKELLSVKIYFLFSAWFFLIFSVFTRALRWNVISGKQISTYPSFWRATNLGYLGNMVLPVRAGDVLRMVAICRLARLPQGIAISSAIVDRVFDGLIMSLSLCLVLGYLGIQSSNSMTMIALAIMFTSFAFFLAGFIRYGGNLPVSLTRICLRFPWGDRVRDWYRQAFEGSQVLRNPGRLCVIVLLSMVAFFLDSLMLFALFSSFAWKLPFMAAVTLTVFLLIGASLPSAPGYVGIYQAACVLALEQFHLGPSSAVALSVVLQAILLLNFLFFGGLAFIRHGRDIRLH